MKALLVSLAILAGGPWTLSDCIDYALQHNLSVRQSEINVQQKEIDLNTAQGRRLPGVSASAGENISFGRGLSSDNTYESGNTASTSLGIGADITIFQGFDIKNAVKAGKLNLAAATADLEKARDDIRVAVAQAYVQILYDKEMLEVARNQVAVDSLLLVRMEAMKASGMASASEVAAQQSTLAQGRLSATQAEGNLSLAILDLSQLLELESPEGFTVEVPDESSLGIRLLPKPEDVYLEAVERKAVVQSESLRLESAKVSIDRAKGAFMPSLSLNGGVGSNIYYSSKAQSASFGKQLGDNFSPYLGLQLNIPIFSRFSTRNQVRSAELSYTNQQIQLESVKKSLYKDIQQAYYNAVAAQAQYVSSREAAKSAETSFNLTREKYENGKANMAEYNEARGRWLEAESNYLQARYKSVFQSKILEFYRGVDLSF